MSNLQDVHYWRMCEAAMSTYGMSYELFSDRIKVKNKRGVLLGSFANPNELINYLHGYSSGLLDFNLYEKGTEEEE